MVQFTDLCKEEETSWECSTCKPQPTTQQQSATRQPSITIRMSRNTQGEWNILQSQPKTLNGKKTTKRQKPAGRQTQATPAAATSTRAGRQPKPSQPMRQRLGQTMTGKPGAHTPAPHCDWYVFGVGIAAQCHAESVLHCVNMLSCYEQYNYKKYCNCH